MFNGYNGAEHGIALNEMRVIKADRCKMTGVTVYDIKIGDFVRQVMNFGIEDEGRRKEFSHQLGSSNPATAFVKGRRFLLRTELVNNCKYEYALDFLYSNNGDTVQYIASPVQTQEDVEGVLVDTMKSILNYAKSCDEDISHEIRLTGAIKGVAGIRNIVMFIL